MNDEWLVVIDPQRIFASPDSPWGAPHFDTIVPVVDRLAEAHRGRTVVTRWLPAARHLGSWADYFETWSFADRPPDDPILYLVEPARKWSGLPTVDLTTFGKWGPELAAVTGDHPHLLLAGVSTDCCVITTALAAADAGAWVTVCSDACAGSDDANHAAALHVMGLYSPQIEVRTCAEILS